MPSGQPSVQPPGSVTAAAASRNDGTNDLLVDDLLRTNELQERR